MFYRDRDTGQYPLTRDDLRARHPHTSFPTIWDEAVTDWLGVDQVFLSPNPDGSPEIEPEFRAGRWWQRFEAAS